MIELLFVVDDDDKACDESDSLVDDDAQIYDKSHTHSTSSLEGVDNGNIKIAGMIQEFAYSTILFTYSSTIYWTCSISELEYSFLQHLWLFIIPFS